MLLAFQWHEWAGKMSAAAGGSTLVKSLATMRSGVPRLLFLLVTIVAAAALSGCAYLQAEKVALTRELADVRRASEAELAARERGIAVLEARLAEVQTHVSLSRDVTALEALTEELTESVASLETRRETLAVEEARLVASISNLGAARAALEQEREILAADVAALETRSPGLSAELAQVEAGLATRREELGLVEAMLATRRSTLSSTETNLERLRAEDARMTTRLAGLRNTARQLNAVKEALRQVGTERDAVAAETETLKARIIELTRLSTETARDLNMSEAALTQMTEARDSARRETEAIEMRRRALETQITLQEQKAAGLDGYIAQQSARLSRLTNLARNAQEQLAAVIANLADIDIDPVIDAPSR